MKERYHISGMTCSACSAHVEKAAGKLEGVKKASVNLLTETMEIEYDENRVRRDGIIRAVEKAGYEAEPLAVMGQAQGRDIQSGEAQDGMTDDSGTDAGYTRGSGAGEPTALRSPDADRTSVQRKAEREAHAMKWRLGISIAFLVPLMYVAMFHMYHEWFGLPIPPFVHRYLHGAENAMTYAMTQFLLLLPILYVNRKFFSVGFRTLGHLAPNMDSLIALGASAAIGYGIFAMYRISYALGHADMAVVEQYSHDLYFESAGMILTLITVGKYLESRSKGKTSEAITKLMDLSPKTAIRVTADGREEEVPTEVLRTGDVFLVKPGSLIPVDGTVLEGNSSVDEAAITGESIPAEKQPGAKVVSATVNKAGFLKCSADRVGEDTTLSRIVRLMEEASASKAPIAQLADKVAGVFVPIVMGIALVTLAVWLIAGAGAEFAISSAIAVLVISCPCALGLATPVAIMVGTGVGASHGILIKSGEALQRAKEVDTVVLDKTGTITSGKLKVMQMECYVPDMAPDTLAGIAAALEKKSEHPLAEALVEYAQKRQLELPEIKDFQAVFGRGVEGTLAAGVHTGELSSPVKEGTRFRVGNRAYLEENGVKIPKDVLDGLEQIAAEGKTPLLVAAASRLLGSIAVADTVKPGASVAINQFRKLGIHVVMLTGDNKRTAEAVRKKLAIEEAVAEVLPQDKEKKIRGLQATGRKVAMVGDGINDAPALAAADVGMAIGAGTDVAMESADIVLMKSDLRDAVTAVSLSRAVIRNIKQNLFWAFFYNAIGIPLAAGVWYPLFQIRLNPMFGAAAMSLSSIFVVGNALRLRGFRDGRETADRRDTGSRAVPANGTAAECNKISNTEGSAEAASEWRKRMTKVMTIEGMMCGHCTGRVQKALEEIEGVGSVAMSLENKTATVELTAEVSDDRLTAAVTDAGYEVKEIR